MMTPPLDHPPEHLPLPPGFARSAAWPVLHVDFTARVAQVFEFIPADYLGAAFLDQRALAPGRSAALLARYAKDPMQRFDADTRRREIDAATARFAGEIEAGMAWAQAALAPLHAHDLQTELG